jgi:hypothetical protein
MAFPEAVFMRIPVVYKRCFHLFGITDGNNI